MQRIFKENKLWSFVKDVITDIFPIPKKEPLTDKIVESEFFSRIGTDGYPPAPFLEPYVILSHHTARAIDNPVARGVLYRETM